uniref:Ribosome receptor lysine/proline rich domain-containing protein n=1 Tax=Electrophorus electricus TaxID=8005 RepID=A0A4W4EKU3_ELEEL
MAIEVADSHYLLILAPSLVIALMFLFFWLFMKETSYDEVLARQKRDLKLPPAKAEARKKSEKKKNKKKESGGSGGGGESEEDLRDFDASDPAGPAPNDEEPEVVPVAPAVAAPVQSEPPAVVRERKKKEKKTKPAGTPAPPGPPVASKEPEVNGSKPAVCKEQTLPLAKQPSPQPAQATPPAPAETTSKKKSKKQKSENERVADARQDQSPVAVKEEPVLLPELRLQDGAAPAVAPPAHSSKKQKMEAAVTVDETLVQSSPPMSQTDSASSVNHQNDEAPPPAPASTKHGKKQKNETDKENSGLKLKELLSSLGGLVLSDTEIVSVVSLLRDKSPNALDSWYKVAKLEPLTQQLAEKERLLMTLKEETAIAKDQVKQLGQELQAEKQKSNRAEAMVREQRVAMEKEMNVMQAKAQGSFQDLQFQKLREQLEGQITHLQQENGILRDAVSSTTSQMENKQSAELNTLRTDYAGLLKDLTETNSKLQQEEVQRKSLEVNYKQNVSQLEDAKRRWDELQGYLHSVNTEREKLQSLQSKLLAIETDLSSKNKEIQTLHSSLTDTIFSKEQVEQKVLQLLEVSQHSRQPDDTLQAKVQELVSENKALQVQIEDLQAQVTSQANTVSHLEELQKLLAEKELQRKSLEDSLNAERSSGASRENNMQVGHAPPRQSTPLHTRAAQNTPPLSLHSLQEREEKLKTVEALLEAGLIEVANNMFENCLFFFFFLHLYILYFPSQQLASAPPSQELLAAIADRDAQLCDVQAELLELRETVELHRRKNNELREKNWSAMEALSATETMLQGKLSKTVKEGQSALESAQAECRALLHRLFPHVPLPTDQNHKQWLLDFESAAQEVSEHAVSLTDKLKEAEETQKSLQKDCETYKKVLAETEGILQRLQSSVEQEESRWKEKLEQAQTELKEMTFKVTALEQEVDRLSSDGELESLRREKRHLESELERAERESATYVSEVRELKDLLTELQGKLDGSYTEAVRQNEELNLLKTQLNETLGKLETEESERQKVAGDLYKVMAQARRKGRRRTHTV